MLFIDRFYLLFLLLIVISILAQCLAGTPPRGARNEMNRALATGVRALSFDSDEENDDVIHHGSARSPPRSQLRRPFSDDEDEGRGASSSGVSHHSSDRRRPGQLALSDSESDSESNEFRRAESSETSGLGSDSDRSRLVFDQSIEGEEGGTLVGLESPIGPKMAGGTPTLGLRSGHSRQYSRHGWKKSPSPQIPETPNKFAVYESPSYPSANFGDFASPSRNGPLASGLVGSLNELYHSPIAGAFHLNRDLWPQEDRRYIKSAKPPPAPGTISVGVMSVSGRQIPYEFLQAVEFGRKHRHKALSSMKWKKTFISGNTATVYGIELNGENLILKISKHASGAGSSSDGIPQCVTEDDITSLHRSNNPCDHQPKGGLIRRRACSAEDHLVPFEYYIAEKVALTRGSMPAAASVPHTFSKDESRWYLMFEELPGISPLKYGENILERLAKPLIRQQLEALEKIAACHIMHLDAHWGNILYSREQGVQLIDFGLATLVDQFELPDSKAALIITFTFDRCLDCEASKLGRDFQHLVQHRYPVDGHTLLSHPWLQY